MNKDCQQPEKTIDNKDSTRAALQHTCDAARENLYVTAIFNKFAIKITTRSLITKDGRKKA